MLDCENFWAFHERYQLEKASPVPEQYRRHICSRLGVQHVKAPDAEYSGKPIWLEHFEKRGCNAVLAEGGGKCWFSAIWFPLVGKKSER